MDRAAIARRISKAIVKAPWMQDVVIPAGLHDDYWYFDELSKTISGELAEMEKEGLVALKEAPEKEGSKFQCFSCKTELEEIGRNHYECSLCHARYREECGKLVISGPEDPGVSPIQ